MCVCVLSLAKNYWAKDIIFLVTSHDEVGMQAWIDAYMGLHTASKNLAEVGQACETSKRTVTKKYIYTREKKLITKVQISELEKKKVGKEKKNRSRQDSNLRGETPMDF